MSTWTIKVYTLILKTTLNLVILKINVSGSNKMVLKNGKEKALSKLKCLNKNWKAKLIGPNKRYKKWLKSPGSLKAKYINGAGIKKRKIQKAGIHIKEKLLENNVV